MKMSEERRAELKAVAEFEPTGDNFSDRVNQQVTNEADLKAVARQAILDLLADLEEAERRNSSFRTLTEAQYGELTQLRSLVSELCGYKNSIESERNANSSLTDQVERLESELASTRKQLAASDAALIESRANDREAMRQLAHWRSNHDNVLAKLRLFTQREDLPVDRIPAYRHVLDLEQQLAEAQALVSMYRDALCDGPENMSSVRAEELGRLGCDDILQSTIAEAVATAVEPYKRDAERYQWLCDVATEGQWVEFGGYTVKRFVDQSIDAARASQDEKLAAKDNTNDN